MRVGIIGTGVAGPTLAYWLRQFGHEPVLFEKASALRTGGYLIDFWGLGFEIAERMGLGPALLERGYKMERLSMVDSDGREVTGIDVRPIRDQLGGRFISLARADLAAALFGACVGVPAHFGVSVSALEDVGEEVQVTLSDGRQERFDVVVGADGLHSSVRELRFGSEAEFETSLGCHVAAFQLSGYPRRDHLTYVSHTVPKRHVARVALRNDETLVLLVCRSELLDGDPPRELQKRALRHAFGGLEWEVPDILNRMDGVDDLYFDRVSQIHLPNWTSGRVALLGDAAASPSLLAGEGTGLAIVEAYVLAGELHRAGRDIAKAFQAYERRLHTFVAGKQRAALHFRGFFAPQTALTLEARNLAVTALSFPFFTKHLVANALRDNLVLPDYTP